MRENLNPSAPCDILLFELERNASLALNVILTRHGYSVTAVYSADELQDALILGGYDVVVLCNEIAAGIFNQSASVGPEFGGVPVVLLQDDFDEISLIGEIRTVIRLHPKSGSKSEHSLYLDSP